MPSRENINIHFHLQLPSELTSALWLKRSATHRLCMWIHSEQSLRKALQKQNAYWQAAQMPIFSCNNCRSLYQVFSQVRVNGLLLKPVPKSWVSLPIPDSTAEMEGSAMAVHDWFKMAWHIRQHTGGSRMSSKRYAALGRSAAHSAPAER